MAAQSGFAVPVAGKANEVGRQANYWKPDCSTAAATQIDSSKAAGIAATNKEHGHGAWPNHCTNPMTRRHRGAADAAEVDAPAAMGLAVEVDTPAAMGLAVL